MSVQKIGPGNPPVKHRWRKGQSGNPKGRPRKNANAPQATPTGPNDVQHQLLEFMQTIVGEIDGKPVSTFEAILKTMRSAMKDKPEFANLLLQYFLQASQNRADWEALVLREALAHKQEWGAKFALAAKLGRPLPNIYPHPDDIIIKGDGSVDFAGPITDDDGRLVDQLLDLREDTFQVVQQINEAKHVPVEVREQMWFMVRRKYYRFSRFIPKRLKRRFPPFVPTASSSGGC